MIVYTKKMSNRRQKLFSIPASFFSTDVEQRTIISNRDAVTTDFSSPLSLPQLQNIVSSIDTDLSKTEQIVANLQVALNTALLNFQKAQQSFMPVGAIFCYAGTQAPVNYHLCDGSALSKVDYPELFAAIGSNYNNSSSNFDTQNYFNIPDLRGMFVRGLDHNRGLDSQGEHRMVGDLQQSMTALPSFAPFIIDQAGNHNHSTFFWYAPLSGYGNTNFVAITELGNKTNVDTSDAGVHNHNLFGGDPETCPVNMALNYIIKLV